MSYASNPEKYRAFDHMIEGVQIISPDFRYVYVNDTVAKQGRQNREDLLGYTMMEKYPGIEQSELFGLIKKCLAERSYKEWINEFDFPDGSKGYFQLRMEAVEEGVLILSFDVTDQKRAEQIIKNTNQQLEELVKTRTSELVEQKLIIEKQIEHLKNLDKTKNKFFSIVAHDLVSPLNSLKSLSSVLSMGLEDLDLKEIAELGQELQQSADNTIKLAHNLIAWARMQMNEQDVHPENIDLKEIIEDVDKLYKDLATKKGVDLSFSVTDNCRAYGDKNQVSFIIRNLVNNAIKFTEDKGSVSVSAYMLGPEEVCIMVADTGIGIPEELKNELLSPDYNHSLMINSGEKGTGLGLVLCREFVGLNNGRIGLESKIGKGSTFRVVLKSIPPTA